MTTQSQSGQRNLFPEERILWKSFSSDLQEAIEEILSLLLEDAATQLPQPMQQESESDHV